MSMKGAKTGLERWNQREGKRKADEVAIRRGKATQQTVEEKGLDVLKQVKPQATTEDVFAVIARDSMEPFVKLWTNSVESSVNKSFKEAMPMLRAEMKDMVREVVQEVIQDEMEQAIRGMVRGMTESIASLQQPQLHVVQPVSAPQVQEVAPEPQMVTRRRGKGKYHTPESIKATIIKGYEQIGNDVYVVKRFKALGAEYSGAYQAHTRDNKREGSDKSRNGWQSFVASVLVEHGNKN